MRKEFATELILNLKLFESVQWGIWPMEGAIGIAHYMQ